MQYGRSLDAATLYTSVDQPFAEPVLRAYEQRTGEKVRAVYDVEAAKTAGLVNRLIAEKGRPQADVFWNSEIVRTVVLKRKDVLAAYVSPSATDIPARYKDPQGYWTGFAARARVLIVNTALVPVEQAPASIFALTEPAWKGRATIAYPLFGTTATHVAALFVALGDAPAKAYLGGLVANDIRVVDGNSVTRDLVADGKVPAGFTDTDDAAVAVAGGKPVRVVYPDRGGLGTLVIPNTVALVAGAPNPEAGKRLIDFLLSREVEAMLAAGESAQMPVRDDVPRPASVPAPDEITAMSVDYEVVADKLDDAMRFARQAFVR